MVSHTHTSGEYKIEVEQGNGGSLLCINVYYGRFLVATIDLHMEDVGVHADIYPSDTESKATSPTPGCLRVPLVNVGAFLERYDAVSHLEEIGQPDGHAAERQPRLV